MDIVAVFTAPMRIKKKDRFQVTLRHTFLLSEKQDYSERKLCFVVFYRPIDSLCLIPGGKGHRIHFGASTLVAKVRHLIDK